MDTLQKLPQHSEVWAHQHKGLYVILDVLNTRDGGSEKFPITISYMSLATMDRYARPWEQFREKFKFLQGTSMYGVEGIIDTLALRAANEVMMTYENELIGGQTQRKAQVQVAVAKAIRAALDATRKMQ